MMLVRLVLTTTLFLLVLGNSTSQLPDELVSVIKDRQLIDKDGVTPDYRQGRMALRAESPSSKAKREQIFRNRLALRRRQALSSRINTSKNPLNNSSIRSRTVANVVKDSLDMLEAQETRHGIYVTAPSGDQAQVIVDDDEELDNQSTPKINLEKFNEESSMSVKDQNNTTMSSRKDSMAVKNSPQVISRNQKHSDDSMKRKNTVVMPEALYNHFRPVESNIPIEDMTQFRYFGQKIRPENTTSNNSVEVTSSSPTSVNLRRRFFVKGFNNVSPSTPMSKLEEIINDEMNIAVEKSAVEKNKILKTKNIFRSTSLYLRKNPSNRLSESAIGSNIIGTNKSIHDPSAHADQVDQLRGSTTYQINVSTQIPREKHQRTDIGRQGSEFESETANSNDVTTPFPYIEDYQSDESIVKSKTFLRIKKTGSISRMDQEIESTTKPLLFKEKISEDQRSESLTKSEDLSSDTMLTEMSPIVKEKLAYEPERISTWLSINSDPVTLSMQESVTPRPINDPTTTLKPSIRSHQQQQQSYLRIVVTEPAIETSQDQNYRNTVKTGNLSAQEGFSTTIGITSALGITTPGSLMTTGVSSVNNLVAPVALAQQMYPYDYTITNVTRLLGNYSGPRVIEKPSTTSKLTVETTIAEEEEEKVTLFPTLSTTVGAREPTRTPGPVSVVPTAAESSASLLSSLVGERGRKGTTFQQRVATVHRNTSSPLESTTEILSTTEESEKASTVRWNHTSTAEINEKEIISERRYLRKSASAVLNQRVGDESIRDFKRRRSDPRRIKGYLRADERNLSRSSETKEHEVIYSFNNKTINTDTMGKSVENETLSTMEVVTEFPNKLINEPKHDANDSVVAIGVDKVNFSTNSSVSNTSVSTSDQIAMSDRPSDLIMTSPQPVTETPTTRPLTSTIKPATIITTTIKSTPVFPVTPAVLDSSNKVMKEEEKIDLNIEGQRIPDRPFGIAKDLDPSEIQKMYRSQTTLKPEQMMTTLPPEVLNPMTSQPKMDTTTKKSLSGERSPEVRGRNLSDKTKDKDDVLPIMHLYNTSNIFNGTEKDLEPGAMTVKTILTSSQTEVIETTINPNEEMTTKNTSQATRLDERDQVPESKDGKTGSTTKSNKNRQEVNREAIQNSTTTKWPIGSTASANKTKNRPNYYIGPPESSGYHPDLNESLFMPGMISTNSRDPINISEVITRRHDGDTLATQETVTVVSYILATLVVFPIAVGVGLILRRLIIKNRKVLEESDTSSEISCRKDALNLENGDFKTSIEKAITKLPRIQHLCHEAEKPPPPAKQESRWEFPRDKLRLQTVLGQGNFGQVWKAEADDLTGHKGTTRLVAVKTVKEGASAREKEDLIRELEIMQQLGNHPNVVTLLGCCTDEEPHYLILEYVMYGKLLAYLRDHRTRQDFYNFSEDSAALTSRDLTVFGYCVARGMEYLASKKIIHRDLAARNVLVDHNKLCKIADFGMSRFANEDGECIETRHGRNALPIRWMAPESLIYSLFTTKTDVWSFGILMWEIVTLGSTPYPDMAAREVMRNVQDGYRLERPSHCRSELFRVIARCWHADPDRRPEFQMLRRDLAQLLEDNMNGHYVDLESFASECTD